MYPFFHWLAISAFVFFSHTTPYTESAYAIDEKPTLAMDEKLIGQYYLQNDPDPKNYFDIKAGIKKGGYYHLSYYNKGGSNRGLETEPYISEIGGVQFMNVSGITDDMKTEMYLLVRLMISGDYRAIDAPVVSDARLAAAKNSAEVRAFMEAHVNDPAIYKDTLHFRRSPGPLMPRR